MEDEGKPNKPTKAELAAIEKVEAEKKEAQTTRRESLKWIVATTLGAAGLALGIFNYADALKAKNYSTGTKARSQVATLFIVSRLAHFLSQAFGTAHNYLEVHPGASFEDRFKDGMKRLFPPIEEGFTQLGLTTPNLEQHMNNVESFSEIAYHIEFFRDIIEAKYNGERVGDSFVIFISLEMMIDLDKGLNQARRQAENRKADIARIEREHANCLIALGRPLSQSLTSLSGFIASAGEAIVGGSQASLMYAKRALLDERKWKDYYTSVGYAK